MTRPTIRGLQAELADAIADRDQARAHASSAQDWADRAQDRALALAEERDWLRALVDRMTSAPPEPES